MRLIHIAAVGVALSWFGFAALLLRNHIRVRLARGPESPEVQARSLRAPESMIGLLLEGIALGLLFVFPRSDAASGAAAVAAIALGAGSVVITGSALAHLGRNWRVKAVVSEDHDLVTTGAYGVVRHPIYLALFGLTLATGLLVATRIGIAAAVIIYISGTIIRIRAEERILERRFGGAFHDYRRRVRAFLPMVW